MKPSILTHSGREFDILNPKPEMVTLQDIAVALSRMPRFAGHTSRFYSVAEHSIWVSGMVPECAQRHALLHDAAEAYLMDLPSPIKQLFPRYVEIEREIQCAIYARFGLTYPEPRIATLLHQADQAALAVERRDLMPPSEFWPVTRDYEGLHLISYDFDRVTTATDFTARAREVGLVKS